MEPSNDSQPLNDSSAKQQAEHDRNVYDYPTLQLSSTEYIVKDVQRTAWGLLFIWLAALLVFVVIVAVMVIVELALAATNFGLLMLVGGGAAGLSLIGGMVAAYIYRSNYFIVTNERILQHIQLSPFSYNNQNIEIERIEDCSYSQNSFTQTLFNYGTIRLSTVGNEHTYIFTFAAQPAEQFQPINNLIHRVDEEEARRHLDR